jgi:hypothetical protein
VTRRITSMIRTPVARLVSGSLTPTSGAPTCRMAWKYGRSATLKAGGGQDSDMLGILPSASTANSQTTWGSAVR